MIATRRVHLGLFLLSSAVLVLEVALTRVFSLLLWGHYSFMIIGAAILGLGAAGSLQAVRPVRGGDQASRRFLSRNALLFAVAVVTTALIATRLDLAPTRIFYDGVETAKFVGLYLLTLLPFLFAGKAICHLLSASSAQVNTVYFADLLGAGAGALAVTVFLNVLGAPATIGLSCTLACLAAWLFAGTGSGRLLHPVAVAMALSVTVAALAGPIPIPLAASKPLREREDQVELSRWSLHGRLDVLASSWAPLSFGSGAHASRYDQLVEYRTLFVDGSNPTRLVRHDQDLSFLRILLTAGPYHLGLDDPRVAIIGSGGGIDTLMALELGAADVTALEINSVTVDLVRNEYADYIGHLFTRPNVHLRAEEGRHFLTLDVGRFDLVRLTGVDTAAAASVGANTLDHAYLYTVEAVRDCWSRLTADGVLAVNRPVGWKGQRLVIVFLAALDELGVLDAADRLMVVSNDRWCDVLLGRRPFTADQVESARRWAEEASMEILYDPFHDNDNAYSRLIRSDYVERHRIIEESVEDLRPVTDDSPYFFEPSTLPAALASLARLDPGGKSGFPRLLVMLAAAAVASAILILLPLLRRRGASTAGAGSGWSLGYFSLLGMGFILAEIVFIQKYMVVLGGPVYAMSVTLFSILVFSGLGAYAAKWIPLSPRAGLASASLAVALLLAISALALDGGLALLLGLGFDARVGFSVLSLAPLGFALGLPFPVGVRLLDRSAPERIPWAFAANACLTVVGSVAAVVLSIHLGFSRVLLLAAACYTAAAVCGARMASPAAPDRGTD
jgi:hypothetical protein